MTKIMRSNVRLAAVLAALPATAGPPVAAAASYLRGKGSPRLHHPRLRYALMAMCVVVALAGCSSSDEPSAEDLLGTWNASFGPTWQIEADRIAIAGGAVAEIAYVATDTTIQVSDDSGCPTGTYEWQIEEDVLTLTVVADSCDGRQANFNGATFERAG